MKLKIGIIIALLTITIIPAYAAADTVFSDMDGHWSRDKVEELTELGIIDGYPDGSFRPEEAVNYGSFAKMLSEVLGMDEKVEYGSPVNDHWSSDYLRFLYDYGVFNNPSIYGPEQRWTLFGNEDEYITREEMAIYIVNAMGLEYEARIDHAALQKSENYRYLDAEHYMKVAVKEGILGGYPDGTFRPGNTVTRAESATILMRLISWMDSAGENDDKQMTKDEIFEKVKPSFAVVEKTYGGNTYYSLAYAIDMYKFLSGGVEFKDYERLMLVNGEQSAEVGSISNYDVYAQCLSFFAQIEEIPALQYGNSRALKSEDDVFLIGTAWDGNTYIFESEVVNPDAYINNRFCITIKQVPISLEGIAVNARGETIGIINNTIGLNGVTSQLLPLQNLTELFFETGEVVSPKGLMDAIVEKVENHKIDYKMEYRYYDENGNVVEQPIHERVSFLSSHPDSRISIVLKPDRASIIDSLLLSVEVYNHDNKFVNSEVRRIGVSKVYPQPGEIELKYVTPNNLGEGTYTIKVYANGVELDKYKRKTLIIGGESSDDDVPRQATLRTYNSDLYQSNQDVPYQSEFIREDQRVIGYELSADFGKQREKGDRAVCEYEIIYPNGDRGYAYDTLEYDEENGGLYGRIGLGYEETDKFQVGEYTVNAYLGDSMVASCKYHIGTEITKYIKYIHEPVFTDWDGNILTNFTGSGVKMNVKIDIGSISENRDISIGSQVRLKSEDREEARLLPSPLEMYIGISSTENPREFGVTPEMSNTVVEREGIYAEPDKRYYEEGKLMEDEYVVDFYINTVYYRTYDYLPVQ